MKKLALIFAAELRQYLVSMELIEWGISAEGTKFEQMYHEYWNPIMAEHQKKADSGK